MPLAKSIPYKYILFVILILLADFVVENINHKFQQNDFKVYYEAAKALTGGQPVYGVAFSLGSGYFKYSPFTAMLFYPLTLLPYYVAGIIEFIFTSVAIILTSITIANLLSTYVFKRESKYPNLILFLSFLCIITHMVRELELGNVNVLILFLLCLSLRFILQKKMAWAGLFIAIVIITKPFFVLVLIPLLMRRYFKTLFTTAISLVLFLILPALFLGIEKDLSLHREWLNAMLIHANAFPSPNTIDAVIRNNINSPLTASLQYIIMLFLLVPYVLFVRANIKNGVKNKDENSAGFVMEWFTLLAIIPSIFKTDTEHFLMTLPVILFILIHLFSHRNTTLTVTFILLIILYAGNSSDLLGKELSIKVYNLGILGISNVLLTGMGLYIFIGNILKESRQAKNSLSGRPS